MHSVLRLPRLLAVMLKTFFPDKKRLVAVASRQDKVMEEGLLKGGGPWMGQGSCQQVAPAGPVPFSIITAVTQTGHEEMRERACFYTVQTYVYNGTSQETRRVEDKFKMLVPHRRVVIQTSSTYHRTQPCHLVPKEGLAVPREDGRD